jgi:glycosyltransferase involved in cell wall biosynthesis
MSEPADRQAALRIMFITALMGVGGEELSTLTLASELATRGHSVRHMSTPGPLFGEYTKRGIQVTVGRVSGRGPVGVVRGAADVRRELAKTATHVLHTQSVVPTIMGFLARARVSSGVPKIVWHDRGIHEWSYHVVANSFNRITDHVIANSDFERDRLIRNGLAPAHVRRIYNCINVPFPDNPARTKGVLRQFGIPEDAFVVGLVSRLAPTKGHSYLFKAACALAGQIRGLRILVVGDGPLRADLERLVGQLEIERLVTFAGVRRDLYALYPAMDLLAVPSLREPFGNVAIEAAAYGTPAVGTTVEGLPEAIRDQYTGILVPPKDPARLADAILRLARQPALAAQMGAAARARVKQHFLPHRVAKEVEQVYQHVLSD